MKKAIVILLTFILSFSIVACSDNTKPTAFDENNSSSQVESTTIEHDTEEGGLKKYIPSQEECFEIMKSAFPEASQDSSIEHVRHNPDSNNVFYRDFEPVDGQIKSASLYFYYGRDRAASVEDKDIYLRIMISTTPMPAAQAESLVNLSYSTLIKFFQNMPEENYPTLQELKDNLKLPEDGRTYKYTYSDDLSFSLDWFYGEDKTKRSINLICDIK